MFMLSLMPYRLQFKGDPDVYSRQAKPLFEKTDKWDRARLPESIDGKVGILFDGRVVSSVSLRLEESELPETDQLFTAAWTDGKLTLKTANGYLEVRSGVLASEAVAVGPASQFGVEFTNGRVRFLAGRAHLAVEGGALAVATGDANENGEFVVIIQANK